MLAQAWNHAVVTQPSRWLAVNLCKGGPKVKEVRDATRGSVSSNRKKQNEGSKIVREEIQPLVRLLLAWTDLIFERLKFRCQVLVGKATATRCFERNTSDHYSHHLGTGWAAQLDTWRLTSIERHGCVLVSPYQGYQKHREGMPIKENTNSQLQNESVDCETRKRDETHNARQGRAKSDLLPKVSDHPADPRTTLVGPGVLQLPTHPRSPSVRSASRCPEKVRRSSINSKSR